MYRKIAFDSRKKQIMLWTWDSNGKRILEYHPFRPYLYVECQDCDKSATSIFKTPLKKIEFDTAWEKRTYVDNTSNRRLFYNLGPEQQFLIDRYYNVNDDTDFFKYPIKFGVFDIEVYCKKGFPHAEKAEHIVSSITIYDSLSKIYHVFGLKNDFDTSKFTDVIYYKFATETLLLKAFIQHLTDEDYDLITGWNSSNFDIPYLYNRIMMLLGQDWVNKISPINRCYTVHKKDKFQKLKATYEFKPLVHIDYIELYRYFKMGEQESYALEYIAQQELGRGKVKYDGNLADLMDTDWQSFIEYNIEDVRLNVEIEFKNKLIALARMLCYKGLCDFSNTLGKVIVTTGCVAIQAKREKMIIPTFKNNGGKEDYIGGFVQEPKRGRKKDIVSFDANSLYPSVMMTLNISPETKVGKIVSDDGKNVIIITSSGSEIVKPKDKILEFCKAESICISSNGILYSQKRNSVVKNFLDSAYNQRNDAKNKMLALGTSLKGMTDKAMIEKIEDEIAVLDLIQNNLKCVLNSFYGGTGNEAHPFYDIDNAASVTKTGQDVIKMATQIVNDYTKSKYGVIFDSVIYGDTDSVYLTIEPILSKLGINILDGDKIDERALKIIKELENELNTSINTWSKDILLSIDSRFKFKRETICDAGIFLKKKNYILHVLDSENRWINKFKYKGVSIAKASTSKNIKNLIKSVIEGLIMTGEKTPADKALHQARHEFGLLPLDDISIRINVKDLLGYEERSDGLDTAKGTPYHMKAALKGNALFKAMGLDKTYPTINAFTRVKLFYSKRNKYKIDALCYDSKFPQELIEELGPDIDKMFSKTVVPLVEDIYDELGYQMPDANNPTRISLDDIV